MTQCEYCGSGALEPHRDGCKWVASKLKLSQGLREQKPQQADAINPSHYRQGGVECIEAMEAAMTPEEFTGYLKGQVIKYLWRLGRKDDSVQESGKALWYAERLNKFLTATSQRGMADTKEQ